MCTTSAIRATRAGKATGIVPSAVVVNEDIKVATAFKAGVGDVPESERSIGARRSSHSIVTPTSVQVHPHNVEHGLFVEYGMHPEVDALKRGTAAWPVRTEGIAALC